MSDLTTPTRTRQRRRRVRTRGLRRALHGARSGLRKARVAVVAALLVGAAGLGVALYPDGASSSEAPDAVETVAVAQPIYLGKGQAGIKASPAPIQEEVSADEEGGEPVGSGEASYYGSELEGNPTASGERFDPEGLTAAHRTLPLGSRLRVTNPSNGESVIVRVNDRGPFARHRVVDVSERAARELGILRAGTARVELELLPKKRG